MKLFYGYTPYDYQYPDSNPLFAFESRRAAWGSSAKMMISYTRNCVIGLCAVLLSVWGLLALEVAPDGLVILTALLFAISLLVTLALDFVCMAAGLGSINGEVSAGHWDLLRLTSLSDEQIIRAKHGMAQLRTWRLMALVVALRLGVALMALLTTLVELYRARPLSLFAAIDIVFLAFGYGWIALFVGAVYVVEPFWRMRALTAISVAISAWTSQQLVGIAAGAAVMLAFWLAQGAVVGLALVEVSTVYVQFVQFGSSVDQIALCAPLVLLGLLVALIYGVYALMQGWSLRHAEGWIARVK